MIHESLITRLIQGRNYRPRSRPRLDYEYEDDDEDDVRENGLSVLIKPTVGNEVA